jgi:hypothetical protein
MGDTGILGVGHSLIYLLIFLLPGLIGVMIFRMLADAKRLDRFDILTFALMLTLLSNFAADFVVGVSLLPDIRVAGDRLLFVSYSQYTIVNLSIVTAASLILGFACVFLNRAGWVYRLFQKTGLTMKTGRINVWHDVFESCRGRWLHVRFKDGTSIIGWPKFFSVDEERFEVFLADAALWEKVEKSDAEDAVSTEGRNGSYIDFQGPGVYINNFEEVLFVAVIGESADEKATETSAS